MSERTRKLTGLEKDELLRWMLARMPAEMRRQLMGEMPVHYKILYPEVSDDTLALRVRQQVARVQGQSDILPRTDLGI